PVYVMDIYKPDSFPQTIQTPMWKIGYGKDNNFYSFVKIQIASDQPAYKIHSGDSLTINTNTFIPPHYLNYLQQHPEINPSVIIGSFQNTYIVKDADTHLRLQDLVSYPVRKFSIFPGLPKGIYSIYFAIESNDGIYTRNSERIKLTVD
ncbi:MAG TPA: hypothetical protein VGO09_00085, partial [Flavisolibacter sp.]|nr:hypothetical protein [Flavisolibacter sp.]